MKYKRRHLSPFSLSFLDIMSCGFGAVVLLFLIIKHNVDTQLPEIPTTPDLESEVTLLEEEILEGRSGLAKLRNTIAEINERIVVAQGLSRRIMDDINEAEGNTEILSAADKDVIIEKLKLDLKRLEAEREKLTEQDTKTGKASRSFIGEGDREYVTGLKLGGKRILILLDISASMLDNTIVNIVRRRNMSDERKHNSTKWQQALKTVDWLTARFPIDSQYQIYTFNTKVKPALAYSKGQWLKVNDLNQFNKVIRDVSVLLPEGGTNLEAAFAAISDLHPLPDNIYLITDGLPTQGNKPARNTTINGRGRLRLFASALDKIPAGISVNVILSPLEGDPMAASAYWQLAQMTQGSFMSPTEDWP